MSLAAEQPLVAQTVDRFLATHGRSPGAERPDAAAEGWSRAAWQEMAALGWLGICLPESAGGLGCAIEERLAVMEAVGRGLVREPYLGTAVLCAELLQAAAGAQAQAARLLPEIAAGRLVLAFAVTEPDSGYEPAATACSAQRDGDGWVLQGRKLAVLDAPIADRLLVLARSAGQAGDETGLSLFLVDPHAAGVTLRAWPTVDGRRCADIAFDRLALPADALVGAAGQAFDAVQYALDHARVASCAEAVGAMQALIATTIAYLKERRQFGQPLARFQVLRHRVADMHIACEQARSLTALAAGTLLPDHPRRGALAAAAKTQAAWSARFVGQQAVQLHGGMGVTDELQVGHWFKRLLATEVLFGNADHQLQRFARLSQPAND